MKSFSVTSLRKEYTVSFQSGLGFLDDLKKTGAVWIIDRNVHLLYQKQFADIDAGSVVLIDASEGRKTLAGAEDIYRQLIARQMKRHMVIVSVGGGITQDVSGFVASTFYRGTRWTYIPTTLLAQGDSCIGSKTSLNLDSSKNLLGTFYPPDEVFISTAFLGSLSPKEFFSGYGEIVKLQLMQARHEADLQFIRDRLARGKSHPDALLELIYDSLFIKKTYIEEYEFDYGRRRLLNYGHCFGHALESASKFNIPHGLAVVVGMLFANTIALKRDRISSKIFDFTAHSIFLPHLHPDLFVMQEDYFDADVIAQNMMRDKKRSGTGLSLVLPGTNLELEIIQDVTPEEVAYGCGELKKMINA